MVKDSTDEMVRKKLYDWDFAGCQDIKSIVESFSAKCQNDDWDDEGAAAIDNRVIIRTLSIIGKICDISVDVPKPHSIPGYEGEIKIVWMKNGYDICITVSDSGDKIEVENVKSKDLNVYSIDSLDTVIQMFLSTEEVIPYIEPLKGYANVYRNPVTGSVFMGSICNTLEEAKHDSILNGYTTIARVFFKEGVLIEDVKF